MHRLILISAGNIMVNFLPVSNMMPAAVVVGSLGNVAILSSVGARLLLNMKEAGEKGLKVGTSSSASRATISGIVFATSPSQPTANSHDEEVGRMEIVEA